MSFVCSTGIGWTFDSSVSARALSVIIPSKTAANLLPCVEAVRKHEPEARIIVVDDGLEVYPIRMMESGPGIAGNCQIISGHKPFIFARNVNLGIRAAGDSDCVILNDDAILETPGGFSIMQAAAAENPQVGIIGAVTDLTGQPAQRRPRNTDLEHAARKCPAMGLRAVEHIAFVCVLLPARTRRAIAEYGPTTLQVFTSGLLDERYTAYGSDDLDYCMQVREAQMLVCVHDACYVNHGSLRSSYRGLPTQAGDIWPNHRILRAKWKMGPNPADPLVRASR